MAGHVDRIWVTAIAFTGICFADIDNNTPKILEIPTLGHQPVMLGGLYSAVEDEFLPGIVTLSTVFQF